MKKLLFVLTICAFVMVACEFKSTCSENEAPAIPFNPVPADEAENIVINPALYWTCIDPESDSLQYDMYFGINSPPEIYDTGIIEAQYILTTLEYSQHYFWQIVVHDNYNNATDGTIWSFYTIANQSPDQPSNPNPVNNAVSVPVDITLCWTSSDPENETLTYDIYFGTSPDPPLINSNQGNLYYDPGIMDCETTYYWKIVASDGENETAGSVWSFMTWDLIFVQGGTYEMGDHFNEGNNDELPAHEVMLNNFYIGKYEVTHTNYIEFLNSGGISPNGSYNGTELIDMDGLGCAIGYNGSFYFEGNNYVSNIECPVIEVTWFGGIVYCNWLSEQHCLTPCYDLSDYCCDFNVDGYRLPTEAEWEYAARGGLNWTDNYRFSGTTDHLAQYSWFYTNSGFQTHEVGTKNPNQLDIFDMSGNVWEWCNDWYSCSYYDSSPADNPTGPDSGSARVWRGGGWTDTLIYCRVAQRLNLDPDISYYDLGFRILKAYP
jgi:formylglycine-generating enzyme required for sulfatase activity